MKAKIEGVLDTVKQEFLLDNAILFDIHRATGKLISFNGGDEIHTATFLITDPENSNYDENDTITLAYHNYKAPATDIDTAMLTFFYSNENYCICPDYDGQKGIKKLP